MAKGSAKVPMQQLMLWVIVGLLVYPLVIAAQSNDDFSNATFLESGVLVSGYVTESDGDNPDDKYQLQVSPGDTIHFVITSDEADICLYMGENGNEELDCFYEGNYGEGEASLYKRETTQQYYVKIDCGSTALECSSSAEYTLKITIHPDEAGDSLDDAADLPPEVRIEGWAPLDEDANPLDFDYYRTPVMEGDTIRVVINSDDMTSYRIYDRYGIKIGEDYEMGDYDLNINVDYTGDLFIELFCVQNYREPCDYSLIAIGSTAGRDGHAAVISESSQYVPLPIIIAVAVFIVLVIALIVNSSRRNNTAIDDQTTISNTTPSGHHIPSPQPLIDPAPIVQPTHSDTTVSTLMQDSVHQGDIVGGDKFDTKVVNDPEAIARAAIKGYEMGKSSDGDESD